MPNELARRHEPVVSSELAAGALASLLSMVTDASHLKEQVPFLSEDS
jgi:hypothetical protein